MSTQQLAHSGEGHTEEELQTTQHTETVQTSDTPVQATTTQPVKAVTAEAKKADVNTTFGILFIGLALAVGVAAVVIALKARPKK